jgi:peptide/nickel transport system substrate-binding protein
VEGFSIPNQRSDRVVLEANTAYWDKTRLPQLHRIIFDNTRGQKDAVEAVKTHAGRVDLVTELSPLETLRVAQSPLATVVKNRGALVTVVGLLNMRKTDSPWRDIRLRQAVNYAINRADLIEYAAKGNGVIIPALVPRQGFGHDPELAPYPFDPEKVQQLLRAAGHPGGLAVMLIAPEDLEVQATVVAKMLEHAGLTVDLRLLDPVAFSKRTVLSDLEQPAAQSTWDIALTSWLDLINFPVFQAYHFLALDGPYDWVMEEPELGQLRERVLGTVDREQQVALIRQMERHTRDQAYFLFLYNPITLYAVNKDVTYMPYVNGVLNLAGTSITGQHWSVQK